VTMGRRDSIFGQFGETDRCRDANFYRTMHFSAKCGLAIACRPSVRPSVRHSVCSVGDL